jgi:hypothetical protein
MIKFTAELEDVCFTAVRSNETGDWTVKLEESEQAKKDFKREKEYSAEIVLNDREMGALLYLAACGGEINSPYEESLYEVIEPKLKDIPNFLRPIP